MPDSPILEFATFTQITLELRKRYNSGVCLVISQSDNHMPCAQWGSNAEIIGLCHMVSDKTLCRVRSSETPGVSEGN